MLLLLLWEIVKLFCECKTPWIVFDMFPYCLQQLSFCYSNINDLFENDFLSSNSNFNESVVIGVYTHHSKIHTIHFLPLLLYLKPLEIIMPSDWKFQHLPTLIQKQKTKKELILLCFFHIRRWRCRICFFFFRFYLLLLLLITSMLMIQHKLVENLQSIRDSVELKSTWE